MLINADARSIPLKDQTVQCVVTSPPYWGLRNYGLEPLVWNDPGGCKHEWGKETRKKQPFQRDHASDGSFGETRGVEASRQGMAFEASQGTFCSHCSAWRGSLGHEPTPDLYVQHLVEIFREVRRTLRDDGTVWLNLGDSYAANRSYQVPSTKGGPKHSRAQGAQSSNSVPPGLKPKDLCGIPWRVAFALQADGWWLRSDIIWAKRNPMPESIRDRPTRSHEYIFLLTKSGRYYYDCEAIKEPNVTYHDGNFFGGKNKHTGYGTRQASGRLYLRKPGRNKRSVWRYEGDLWTGGTQPYKGVHFATFPEALVEPCVLAGCPTGGTVLDPFCGAGTTVVVVQRFGRVGIGLELKWDYLILASDRETLQSKKSISSKRRRDNANQSTNAV